MTSSCHNISEKLLTVSELSEWLNLSIKTIYRLTARKEIPFYRLGTGKKGIRFKVSEILEWLKSKKEEPVELPKIRF